MNDNTDELGVKQKSIIAQIELTIFPLKYEDSAE